jgi:hypothetical protein
VAKRKNLQSEKFSFYLLDTFGYVDTGGASFDSANFSKKFEMTLVLFSGAWGKMIHEKNLKQKIS